MKMKIELLILNIYLIEKLTEQLNLLLSQNGEKTKSLFNVAIWIIG